MFTNEGTVYGISSRFIPNDFEDAAVNKFQDYEDTRVFKLEIDRDTVKDADPATTLENIIGNATIGVNKQITDVFETEENITDNDVAVWSVVESLGHNMAENKTSDLLTNADVVFELTVRTYYKNVPTS